MRIAQWRSKIVIINNLRRLKGLKEHSIQCKGGWINKAATQEELLLMSKDFMKYKLNIFKLNHFWLKIQHAYFGTMANIRMIIPKREEDEIFRDSKYVGFNI